MLGLDSLNLVQERLLICEDGISESQCEMQRAGQCARFWSRAGGDMAHRAINASLQMMASHLLGEGSDLVRQQHQAM